MTQDNPILDLTKPKIEDSILEDSNNGISENTDLQTIEFPSEQENLYLALKKEHPEASRRQIQTSIMAAFGKSRREMAMFLNCKPGNITGLLKTPIIEEMMSEVFMVVVKGENEDVFDSPEIQARTRELTIEALDVLGEVMEKGDADDKLRAVKLVFDISFSPATKAQTTTFNVDKLKADFYNVNVGEND